MMFHYLKGLISIKKHFYLYSDILISGDYLQLLGILLCFHIFSGQIYNKWYQSFRNFFYTLILIVPTNSIQGYSKTTSMLSISEV